MKIIEHNFKKPIGWIRIFGYGIRWKDLTMCPELFSERNGYCKIVYIGKWSIKWLDRVTF